MVKRKQKKTAEVLVPIEAVEEKIILIRGHKVILDADLAKLYGVETGQLNRAVKRNITRFPDDFMFILTSDEFDNLKCQFGTSSWGGRRTKPLAFTEQGVAMLSSVLRSDRAVQVNVQIMRAFVKMRELIAGNQYLRKKVKALEKKYEDHEGKFELVFDAISKLLEPPAKPRKKIGFHK